MRPTRPTIAFLAVLCAAVPAIARESAARKATVFDAGGFSGFEVAGQFALGTASSAATGIVVGYVAGRMAGLTLTMRAHPRDLREPAAGNGVTAASIWGGHALGATYGAYHSVIEAGGGSAPPAVKAATALGAVVACGLSTYLARAALSGDREVRLAPALAPIWIATAASATFAYRAVASRMPKGAIASAKPGRIELDPPLVAIAPGQLSAEVLRARF